MKAKAKVKLLVWQEHHVKGNGWLGYTPTGAHIVYVYRPAYRGRRRWAIYQYWGANPDRCKNFGELSHPATGKPHRYTSAAAAKLAAQHYWRREVRALLA